MFIREGSRFNIYAAFTFNDIQYPAGAFQDPVLRSELGITEVADPHRGDEAFYTNLEIDHAPWIIVTPRPLSEVKAKVLSAINAECEARMADVRKGYPESEILSWPKQEAEARQYIAEPGGQFPLLESLASSRQIEIAELANRIVLKADAYAAISGKVIGTRQLLEDRINAVLDGSDVEVLRAIVWPSE